MNFRVVAFTIISIWSVSLLAQSTQPNPFAPDTRFRDIMPVGEHRVAVLTSQIIESRTTLSTLSLIDDTGATLWSRQWSYYESIGDLGIDNSSKLGISGEGQQAYILAINAHDVVAYDSNTGQRVWSVSMSEVYRFIGYRFPQDSHGFVVFKKQISQANGKVVVGGIARNNGSYETVVFFTVEIARNGTVTGVAEPRQTYYDWRIGLGGSSGGLPDSFVVSNPFPNGQHILTANFSDASYRYVTWRGIGDWLNSGSPMDLRGTIQAWEREYPVGCVVAFDDYSVLHGIFPTSAYRYRDRFFPAKIMKSGVDGAVQWKQDILMSPPIFQDLRTYSADSKIIGCQLVRRDLAAVFAEVQASDKSQSYSKLSIQMLSTQQPGTPHEIDLLERVPHSTDREIQYKGVAIKSNGHNRFWLAANQRCRFLDNFFVKQTEFGILMLVDDAGNIINRWNGSSSLPGCTP
ncbi:MAG: hypothetical protein NTV34_15420 [Proteobacteria bacterium]|nr:hypothetical protein [Pseudomonadota bacterium]